MPTIPAYKTVNTTKFTRLVNQIGKNISKSPLMDSASPQLSELNVRPVKVVKPLVVSFDAYDTIYEPVAPVHQQYHAIVTRYKGNWPSEEEISTRYRQHYSQLCQEYPNYGKSAGWPIEKFWKTLLNRVFHDGEPTIMDAVVSEIASHFSSHAAYHVFEDVEPLLQALAKNGVIPAVASNADEQVTHLVLHTFGLIDYFGKENIFLSYHLELSKPDPAFFEKIGTKLLELKNGEHSLKGLSKAEIKDHWWHVGDDYKKDVLCSQRAGIRSVLLDRKGQYGFLKEGEDSVIVHDRFIVARSLLALIDLFGMNESGKGA
ncbi:hypothetical protein LJB42_000305 [Komagataella kurtzmanii]|nr:hypothetical protein LJB42_000305 [Komagataella kurtzmanii]